MEGEARLKRDNNKGAQRLPLLFPEWSKRFSSPTSPAAGRKSLLIILSLLTKSALTQARPRKRRRRNGGVGDLAGLAKVHGVCIARRMSSSPNDRGR